MGEVLRYLKLLPTTLALESLRYHAIGSSFPLQQ